MLELRLTPHGSLRLDGDEAPVPLRQAFEQDWRQGLFQLGAGRERFPDSPTLAYWQEQSRRYLSALCREHGDQLPLLPPPPLPEREHAALAAPPMAGGEYLTPEVLADIWDDLDEWARSAFAASGGRDDFLQSWAPRWRQVGRVYFHLAENKDDPDLPFAFMVTYTTGLTAGGRARHLPLRKSLEQYAGNREALIRLLSPIQRAAQSCPWVAPLLASGEIYQATAWPVEKAYEFLTSIAALEECGLSVLLPNWWKKRPRPRVSVTIGGQKSDPLNAGSLLEFDVRVALGEERLNPDELRELLAGPEGLVLFKGQWVEVDRDRLEQALGHWEGLKRQAKLGQISFVEGMRLLAGASEDLKSEARLEEERPWIHLEAGQGMRELLELLRRPEAIEAADPGPRLQATLRDYQKTGVNWLNFLSRLGLGACLADDMGLGKTIQVLSLLLAQQGQGPSLLVVPASLLGNWKEEARRFAPSLRLLFVHPSETDKASMKRFGEAPEEALAGVDLAVTTYSMVTRQPWLGAVSWNLAILDEAQTIKNPSARQTQAVKKLQARARVAMTGTPVENRLGDLWSLFDFLNPGLLGSASVFGRFVKALQERPANPYAPLRQLVGPYILRRLKTDKSIISDLPDKIETRSYCGLTKPQIRLYESCLKRLQQALRSTDGMARRGLVLQSLMQLKQICNHPSQFSGEGDYEATASGKFQRLAEICSELAERQERVLVFTQFREIMDPLQRHLTSLFGRPGLVLHGGTAVKERQKLVRAFSAEDGPPFFLLSLKAGGTGLNLVRAAHVVHFDRWWNPAVENQATDRAFRLGQKSNVMVHKFVTRGTVEERIDALIASKQQLADELLSGESEVNLTELSDEALLQLVRLDVGQASL